MASRIKQPVALTVAGSDSGGGAGIQADLKTFAALGVHGTSVLTCVTAQNPRRVSGIQACSPKIVRSQLEAVFAELLPAAIKTGMLLSPAIIRVVVDFLRSRGDALLVVDPVMAATSGSQLMQPSARRSLDVLLSMATLVTPNVDEARALTGIGIRNVEDLRAAARALVGKYGCAALVKGGHLQGQREAVDIFFDGNVELLLSAPYIPNVSTHGTGCTYSAAITAFLSRGVKLRSAVVCGKEFISNAINSGIVAAGHFVLNSLWELRSIPVRRGRKR